MNETTKGTSEGAGKRKKLQINDRTVKDLAAKGAEKVKGGVPRNDNGDYRRAGFENMPPA